MKALGHYLIVEEIPEPVKKHKSGLEFTEKTREDIRYRKAKTISVGEEITILEPQQEIMYDRAAGHNIDVGDLTYKVITIRDVVAVL